MQAGGQNLVITCVECDARFHVTCARTAGAIVAETVDAAARRTAMVAGEKLLPLVWCPRCCRAPPAKQALAAMSTADADATTAVDAERATDNTQPPAAETAGARVNREGGEADPAETSAALAASVTADCDAGGGSNGQAMLDDDPAAVTLPDARGAAVATATASAAATVVAAADMHGVASAAAIGVGTTSKDASHNDGDGDASMGCNDASPPLTLTAAAFVEPEPLEGWSSEEVLLVAVAIAVRCGSKSDSDPLFSHGRYRAARRATRETKRTKPRSRTALVASSKRRVPPRRGPPRHTQNHPVHDAAHRAQRHRDPPARTCVCERCR